MKRLYKSETNKVFTGVMGGIGDYFNVDPVLIRVAYILLDLVTGVVPGIIAYLVMAIIVPKPPTSSAATPAQ